LPEKVVDFAAVGRISQRVELKTVRLMEMIAKCVSKAVGPLEAKLESNCSVLTNEKETLEVLCDYKFSAHAAEREIASALVKYVVSYELRGEDPVSEEDLAEFALANGTSHSWPFVRECIYSLTSRMGYPPYTLPVVHFKAKPQEKKNAIAEKAPAANPVAGNPDAPKSAE
jgi:preprotein translocase subunit SecB